MNSNEVPMTFFTNKSSKDVFEILMTVYLIYGISAFVLLFKIIKRDLLERK